MREGALAEAGAAFDDSVLAELFVTELSLWLRQFPDVQLTKSRELAIKSDDIVHLVRLMKFTSGRELDFFLSSQFEERKDWPRWK